MRINAMRRAAQHGMASSLKLLCSSADSIEIADVAQVLYDVDTLRYETGEYVHAHNGHGYVLSKDCLQVFKMLGLVFSTCDMIWWQR